MPFLSPLVSRVAGISALGALSVESLCLKEGSCRYVTSPGDSMDSSSVAARFAGGGRTASMCGSGLSVIRSLPLSGSVLIRVVFKASTYAKLGYQNLGLPPQYLPKVLDLLVAGGMIMIRIRCHILLSVLANILIHHAHLSMCS